MFYRAPLQWGKWKQTQSLKMARVTIKGLFLSISRVICGFLLQSMLVLLIEAVNMDDIERSNVNQFMFHLCRTSLEIAGPSGFNTAAFSLCMWSSFSFPPAVTCETEPQSTLCENWLRQFAVSRPCDIFALLLY